MKKTRNRIINRLIYCLILVVSSPVCSQVSNNHHYIINDHISTNDSVPYLGCELEFVTSRKYFKSNYFSETRIFSGDDSKSLYFRIEKGVWFYKKNKYNAWSLFYNFNTKVGGCISMNKEKYRIYFNKEVVIRNDTLHEICLKPVNIWISHIPIYYMTYSQGVVIIETGGGFLLIRKDYFMTPLNEDEIERL